MKSRGGVFVCLLLLASSASAFDVNTMWHHLWSTKDQQGQALMAQNHFAEAAQTFENKAWQAAATYRSGQYDKAAQLYREQHGANAAYNLGNALAKQHHYEAAISAYQKALKTHPDDQDAQHNKKLVESLLKQKPPKASQSEDKKSTGDTRHPAPLQSEQQSKKQSEHQFEKQPEQQPEKQSEQQSKQQSEKQSEQQSEQSQHQQQNNDSEAKQAKQRWLQLVPEHPGGLLHQQFLRDHLRRRNGGAS